jgi:hypothetical protein
VLREIEARIGASDQGLGCISGTKRRNPDRNGDMAKMLAG